MKNKKISTLDAFEFQFRVEVDAQHDFREAET